MFGWLNPDRHDEPDRPGSFTYKFMKLWPPRESISAARIVRTAHDQIKLEVMAGGAWMTMMEFDDGYDQWGKLHKGRWLPLEKWEPTWIGEFRYIRDMLNRKNCPDVVE